VEFSPDNQSALWEAVHPRADPFPASQFSSARVPQVDRQERGLRFVPANGVRCIPRAKVDLGHAQSASVPVFRRPGQHVPAAVPVDLRGVPANATFRAA
jgi:hypothetical protein